MEKKRIEELIDELPYGIMALAMPSDDVLRKVDHQLNNRSAAKNAVDGLSCIGVDISPLTDGLDEESRTMFTNLLMSLVISLPDFGTAGMLAILLRKYLIPMAQRKQALERMIIALGKGEEDGHSHEAD